MMKQAILSTMVFLLGMMLFALDRVSAEDAALLEASGKCLECHAQRGIVKKFENGESIEAFIDSEKYGSSVHHALSCPACHHDFSADNHPVRRFRSKSQFRIQSTLVCRQCHKDEEVRKKSIHANLFQQEQQGDVPLCTDCHTAHAVTAISGGRLTANETQYCLSCHQHHMKLKFKDGSDMALVVDRSDLSASAHSKLGCSDCHYGFSSEEHPQRNFKTKRDYSIASAESCRRCHFDKYTQTLESICHTKQSQGNLNTPICTDCHGSHAVAYVRIEKNFSVLRCRKCHPDIYDTYAKSVHGKALFNEENRDVPVCIDCHKVHNIKNPLALEFHERIPEMCSNCHANKAIVGKYGLSTDVVKTYLSDFHGMTLGLYKKQREALSKPARPIAVCTDCHGIHNISSTHDMPSAVVKENLLKQCQKCHHDATERFQDAWLSHYKPSLSRTPIVFLVDMGYRIFLPILLVGLFLQILLHIWRYAVNR